LPAPPRWAPPALPARAPSGDWAADATEVLLARVVDPFGAWEDEQMATLTMSADWSTDSADMLLAEPDSDMLGVFDH